MKLRNEHCRGQKLALGQKHVTVDSDGIAEVPDNFGQVLLSGGWQLVDSPKSAPESIPAPTPEPEKIETKVEPVKEAYDKKRPSFKRSR